MSPMSSAVRQNRGRLTTTAFPDTDADKRLILAAIVHTSSANAILRKTVDGWMREKRIAQARAALKTALAVLDEEDERREEAELGKQLEARVPEDEQALVG